MNTVIEWANGVAAQWTARMWPALWQTAVLAAIVGLILLVARRTSPALRFWLWMLAPLRLLVMPLIAITLPVLPQSPAAQPGFAAAPQNVVFQADADRPSNLTVQSNLPAEPAFAAIQRRSRVSGWTWIMACWAVGVGFFSLRLTRGWQRTRKIARQAREIGDPRVRDCAGEAAALLGLRNSPRILSTPEAMSPFVLGFFRPVVVLPAALAEHVSPEELRTVLAHEFAHVRRGDALTGWTLACCDVVYFFNPVVHLVKRMVLFERERACDEQVLALAKAPRAVYARALLHAMGLNRAAATRVSCAPILLESGRFLEQRLKSVAKEKRPRAGLSRTARFGLPVILLLALPGFTLTARSATAPDAAAATTNESRQPMPGAESAVTAAEPANAAGARTYDVWAPKDWKNTLSIGRLTLIEPPFYGVPWNFGLWQCVRIQFPLKNLTDATLYEEVSYRTESEIEGYSNAEMTACYTLKPGEERVIDAIVPIASTERPVKFLLRLWDPLRSPPTSQWRHWRDVGLVIDPLPVAKPSLPADQIEVVKGTSERFSVGTVRLGHTEAMGNFLEAEVRNKTDTTLPLEISVAVNDPAFVENNISPVPREHGTFNEKLATVAAMSTTTVTIPYKIAPAGTNLLLAFSVHEPQGDYATYGERDDRRRDVALVAWGTANLVKAAERGECVIPPRAPAEERANAASEAAAREKANAQPSQRSGKRYYVRVVVGTNKITFQGKDTTWDQLPALLEQVPDRPHTVLELSVESGQLPVARLYEAVGRLTPLVSRLGFEYLSQNGVHPLDSKGSEPKDLPEKN